MRNNSRKMIVADCWKYVSLLLQVQKGKECHSEAIRPRQSLIADSEWQLLRVILSPNFHTKQKWQLIRLSTFKVFQSASSRSKPIWIHMKTLLQMITCIKILFSMIFDPTKKISIADGSSLCENFTILNWTLS